MIKLTKLQIEICLILEKVRKEFKILKLTWFDGHNMEYHSIFLLRIPS